jgi:predicted O-linked N-acetylglucosamine transferase (SPINDLY family)
MQGTKSASAISVEPLQQLLSVFIAGRYSEAEALAEALVAQDGAPGLAWKILGYAKLAQEKNAIAALRKALAFFPEDAELCGNLGNAYRNFGQHDSALVSYRTAVMLAPQRPLGHYNLGAGLQDQHKLAEALQAYSVAIRLKPDFAEAYNQLGIVKQKLGRVDEAIADFHTAIHHKPDFPAPYSNLLFYSNYATSETPERLLAQACNYGALVRRSAQPYTSWPNARDVERCLRIGLVSGDLRSHPVAYFLDSVLDALMRRAPGRFEIVGYSNHNLDDAQTARIKKMCHGWHAVANWSDAALVEQIRNDGIDILFDLSGHTNLNRLPIFAWKPAPVQVSWLGFYSTTGVTAIDYLLADPVAVTPEGEAYFTEKIWRLPEVFSCFSAPDLGASTPEVSPLPALQNGYVTFGSFNNLAKLNDKVLALWARILQRLPGSRLFLKTRQLGEPDTVQAMRDKFAAHGIGAERLILEGHSPRAELLAAYQRVDIVLDPFPYTGCTTTAEALWMGVPVLTKLGDTFLGRQSASFLHAAGLQHWIAADDDDYVACAIACVDDLPALSRLRQGLRQQVLASPVYDADRFAGHFEAALRGMWMDWCAA